AHLLAALPPAALATSDFARTPVGDGPFKWVRGVAGQVVELAANRDYFLGAPKLDRVIFRASADGDTRMTLLLSGEGDALENILPLTNQDRVRADSDLRLLAVPTFMVGYFLYNQRDPADHAKPHPIFADRGVRRALTLALDRETMARSVFGPAVQVPIGPASLSLWVHLPEPAARQDTAAARALLRTAGWTDHDGDGILDKDGRPLAFTILFPAVSAARRQVALQAQASWKAIGADVTLESVDFATYLDRRRNNRFDVDVSAVVQDPSPTGLIQSWTCASMGGANVASYCDPVVDSLIAAATLSSNSLPLWRQVLRTIDADAPAAFIFAPTAMIAVHRRYRSVVLHPESLWSGLGEWSVAPGQQLPRDRDADR
ncbi:MAG: ABC transporter substrate-binding protein, partial [Gemmatimonadales bacterium]